MAKYVVELEYRVRDWDAQQPTPPGMRGETFVVEAPSDVDALKNAADEFKRIEGNAWLPRYWKVSRVVVRRFVGDA